MSSLSTEFILACIFVGCAALLGLFTLFVKAENMERNTLVGGMTLSTTLIALLLLNHDFHSRFRYGTPILVGICVVSILGFGIGWGTDFLMGPRSIAFSEDTTLGSDLSD